ncbi:MAG: secretin N-terminal domain-containing protein [Sedimentisphaeraceae bacterium JB056]
MEKKSTFESVKTVKVLSYVFIICLFSVSSLIAGYGTTIGGESEESLQNISPIEKKLEKKITVDFLETPIEDVLRMVAQTAEIDIVKSPRVTGMVTATLNDVPVGEVLDNILAVQGCGYVKTENMIRVVPQSELNNLNEKVVSKVYRITYADSDNVAKALSKFISSQGSLSVNPGTSNIVVTDTESKIKAIDEFIDEVDRVTEQVVVEVRVYDVSGDDSLNLDIDWNMGRVSENSYGERVAQTTGNGIQYSEDTANDEVPEGPVKQNSTKRTDPFVAGSFDNDNGGSVRIGFLNDSISIDLMLSALRSQGYAKLLANPSILVLDNETADFEIIKEIPYKEESDTSQGGRLTSTKFKEVGVKLQVTPHITRDEMLRMHIMPEFGLVEDINAEGAPTVNTRRIDTIALLKNGQTVVLGGLKQLERSKDYWKTPIFGDLPLIAPLFRSETETVKESELLVFIKPMIIKDTPAMSEFQEDVLTRTQVNAPYYPGKSRIRNEDGSVYESGVLEEDE